MTDQMVGLGLHKQSTGAFVGSPPPPPEDQNPSSPGGGGGGGDGMSGGMIAGVVGGVVVVMGIAAFVLVQTGMITVGSSASAASMATGPAAGKDVGAQSV